MLIKCKVAMQTSTAQTDNTSLRRLVDNVAEVLYSVTFSGAQKMSFVSAAAEDLTGYSPEDILSDNPSWSDIVHQDDRKYFTDTLNTCAKNGQDAQFEYRLVHKNGDICHVLDRVRVSFDDKGQPNGADGIILDITVQKQAQKDLERTQMLQNIGKLCTGIAHEINTPIQFVGDNLHFLSDSFEQVFGLMEMLKKFMTAAVDGRISEWDIEKIAHAEGKADLEFITGEIPQAIEQSLEGIKRVLHIVVAMRSFSHIDQRRKAPADLNTAIESTLVILQNELKYVAEVKTELDPNLPKVMCCIDDMNQVFMNLLINAAHSVSDYLGENNPERGLVTVKTGLQDGFVVISIADTGTGIAPEIQDKIFEPFFTTKAADRKGTGQGLSFTRSTIIDKHAGDLDFETEVGVGTTFTIRLPVKLKGRTDG